MLRTEEAEGYLDRLVGGGGASRISASLVGPGVVGIRRPGRKRRKSGRRRTRSGKG